LPVDESPIDAGECLPIGQLQMQPAKPLQFVFACQADCMLLTHGNDDPAYTMVSTDTMVLYSRRHQPVAMDLSSEGSTLSPDSKSIWSNTNEYYRPCSASKS
jgi:hypothetical protein